jgi:hypothetical protein
MIIDLLSNHKLTLSSFPLVHDTALIDDSIQAEAPLGIHHTVVLILINLRRSKSTISLLSFHLDSQFAIQSLI